MVWLREHKGVTQGPHLAAMKQQTLEALLHVVSLRLTEKTNDCGIHYPQSHSRPQASLSCRTLDKLDETGIYTYAMCTSAQR